MVLEIAVFTIDPARANEFEAVFVTAVEQLKASEGYQSHELQRSIENPGRYTLLVQWATLEAHTEGFRGSPRFTEWRAQVGPFFAAPPQVEHAVRVAGDRA